MAYNKFVTKAGEVMLDLTQDTVTEEDVAEGVTFHTGEGEQKVGTLSKTSETPVFDLAALGLPNIPYGNQEGVEFATDTTEIMAALAKGAVTFKVNATMGDMVAPLVATVNPITIEGTGEYMCAAYISVVSDLDCLMIAVREGGIWANAAPISAGGGEEISPTSIDLSGLESSGQIIETYADGSTKTTQFEFDASGNPTKITDGDGNVTTLIW